MRKVAAKETIRVYFLEKRLKMAFEEVSVLSRKIRDNFFSTEEFLSARRIALYASFRNEPLTDDIFLKAIELRKEVFFPRVVKNGPHIGFFSVRGKDELTVGSYEILEPPAGASETPVEGLDCIVAPGVVFDRQGGRVGYGRGYYDRILKKAECPIVALAYDFQVLKTELIALDPHDVRVTAIVTPQGIERF
jgi:5-formyltetrahydrofolate cyclo-ligase